MLGLTVMSLTTVIGYRFYNQPQLSVGTVSPVKVFAPNDEEFVDEKTTEELETILSDYLAGSTSASDDDSAGVEKYNSGGDAVLEAMQRLQGK